MKPSQAVYRNDKRNILVIRVRTYAQAEYIWRVYGRQVPYISYPEDLSTIKAEDNKTYMIHKRIVLDTLIEKGFLNEEDIPPQLRLRAKR